MCGNASAGMPTPVSSTWSSSSGPVSISRTTTRPPRGVKRIALAPIDDQLVQPLRVAEEREVRPEAFVLEGDARLLGLRVDLLDDAVYEPREVDWPAVELHEPGAQARHLEDLIHEPEQPLGALSDNVREAPLPLRERAGGALAEKVDRAVDRRERRPELVRDGREELGFRLLHLAELARH